MEFFIYGMIVLGVVVCFFAALLAALAMLSAAFVGDPEFEFESYLDDKPKEDMPMPLLGVVQPKEKRDTNA